MPSGAHYRPCVRGAFCGHSLETSFTVTTLACTQNNPAHETATVVHLCCFAVQIRESSASMSSPATHILKSWVRLLSTPVLTWFDWLLAHDARLQGLHVEGKVSLYFRFSYHMYCADHLQILWYINSTVSFFWSNIPILLTPHCNNLVPNKQFPPPNAPAVSSCIFQFFSILF